YHHGNHRDLHSFPTRRSSDLRVDERLFFLQIRRRETLMQKEKYRLQLPGPTPIPPRVQLAMSRPMIGHRDPDCAQLVQDLSERRSEEHTSELQSRENLVCRLL